MADDKGLTKKANGDYVYRDVDGDTLELEWARGTSGAGDILVRARGGGRAAGVGYGGNVSLWIKNADIDAFIEAVQDLRNPPCQHCNGSGKAVANHG